MNAADPSGSLCTSTLHKLVWLKGELECKSKLVQKLCSAYQKLADKIHRCTLTTSPISRKNRRAREHLSTHEVFLLRYPNQMKVHLAKLGKCVGVLQKLIEWQECEPLFWQWMESVLDVQDEEEEELEENECERNCDIPSEARIDDVELEARVISLQDEFERLLKKNKSHMDRLQHVWEYKSRTVSHKDINTKLHLIREHLKYEYPLIGPEPTNPTDAVSSVVERLDAIDCPVYRPAQISVGHSRTMRPALPTPAQEAESATEQLTQTLRNQLEAIHHQLGELDRAIEGKTLEIRDCLESMEAKLPATICKIELGHLVHHKNQDSDVS